MYEIVKKYKDGRVHILLYTPDIEELPVELFEIYSTAEYTGLDGITTNYILVKDSDTEELAFVVKKEEISGGSGSEALDGITSQLNENTNEINNIKTDYAKKTDVNDLASEKAEKNDLQTVSNELNVQKARIDTFTSLAQGSTTGDAELIDARIDFLGNEHSNVGSHLRENSKFFYENMDKLITSNLYNKNTNVKGYLNKEGNIMPSETWFVTDFIDIDIGNVYADITYDNITEVGVSPRNCYYDENKQLISVMKAKPNEINYIPVDLIKNNSIKYVRFSLYQDDINNFTIKQYIDMELFDKHFKNFSNNIQDNEDEIQKTNNYLLDIENALSDENNIIEYEQSILSDYEEINYWVGTAAKPNEWKVVNGYKSKIIPVPVGCSVLKIVTMSEVPIFLLKSSQKPTVEGIANLATGEIERRIIGQSLTQVIELPYDCTAIGVGVFSTVDTTPKIFFGRVDKSLKASLITMKNKINTISESINTDLEKIYTDESICSVAKNNVGYDKIKAIHLDCARKYFSVENIKKLIDLMSANEYTHLQLYFLDTLGFRFGLDDMTISANGTTYDISKSLGDGVEWVRRDGSGIMYPDGSNKWLTQDEMTTIIKYAKSKNIEIIPCMDMPGHMGGLLKDFTQFEHNGTKSHHDLDIYNEKAIQFILAIVDKYADYFAKQGCKYYNFGGDEVTYASNNETFKKYYSDFINRVANIVIRNGLIPLAFCESIYFCSDTNYYVNRRIISCYWDSGANYPTSTLQDKNGIELINTSSALYWVLGVSSPNETTVKNFNYKEMKDGNAINNARGVMMCIWCDFADRNGQDDGTKVIEDFSKFIPMLPTPN